MQVTQHIQKWGNGTGIRLPKKLLDEAKLRPGQTVAINLSGSSIVLTPVNDDTDRLPNLAELLRGVTPGKVGGEYNWGADQSHEKVDG
jgi:antitoxin component of MazEF toxin-antitoxin module